MTLRGFLMGSVDVVPGVSGGTIALLVGIYEELIQSIRMVGQPVFWHALLRFRIPEALRLVNWTFLLALFIGIGLAIVTLAPGIEWMLDNQPELIWSFFFGLVLASIISVARRIHGWNMRLWLALLAGAIGAFIIVGMVPRQTPDTWWFLIFSGALAASAMTLARHLRLVYPGATWQV
ncbi:MAG: DUF368 domain-containing protein [Caldilineaceae bacterium]|nr:DUF368 domain-containing protein [Caldilineaceae bacterium]